jgi:heterodisulfide reductase subunit A
MTGTAEKSEKKSGENEKAEEPRAGGPRIGVFICHCGLNIGRTVDCAAVAEWAKGLPNVVHADHNMYSCSESGQVAMKNDIKEHRLNKVVVASCTPKLHEPTFRSMCEEAGLNKYDFEMANIREHCSWVHHDMEVGTEKAKDLVAMAVAKSNRTVPQVESEVPVARKALVIGGGVAGIQAALDLGDAGYKVYLVEKSPSIGGVMARIDKTFPTMDCSICILAPKMSEVGRHPNVELLALSEVVNVEGYIGNFKVTVRKHPRYTTRDCTACGECSKVCPVATPNEFDEGLRLRRAIYTPFAQAVPSQYLINMDDCLGHLPIACGKCLDACEAKAIDFEQTEEDVELGVGTIIVATGVDVYDPTELKELGYKRFENVITTMEFERLINAGGPTGGHLIRLTDGEQPKRIAFIQCIGSRSEKRGNPYCSNICCMETIKDTLLIAEHYPGTEIVVFYMDIRAFGKGFEDLYKRSKMEGVKFIRGIPAEITETPEKNLKVRVEDTSLGEVIEKEFDMVILSVGIKPNRGSDAVRHLLALSTTQDGFFMEAHPKLRPVDAPTGGVFFAGCSEGPKDIKDSVTQASAAASRANILMAQGKVKIEAITSVVSPELCIGCGACVKVCPYHAITLEKDRKVARVIEAACAGCGTCGAECKYGAITMRHFTDGQIGAQIDAGLKENADKKVLAFCCNWCSYGGADFAGVSRMQYPESVRIVRTMCSGRVSEKLILLAMEGGAGCVLVSGCHLTDCHYINANHQTKKRVEKLWQQMEKDGLRKDMLQLEWVSASEGMKWANTVRRCHEVMKSVTKDDIKKLQEWAKQKRLKADKVKKKAHEKLAKKRAGIGEESE